MLPVALDRLFKLGVEEQTRNGPVLRLPGPTILHYTHPEERVMFWPERNANPFFHLYEAFWMLAGREDVASLTDLLPSMKQFSDDGEIFNGAYGYRWRKAFGFDQLTRIVHALRSNPGCRRQVLQMWSPNDLLNGASRDLPCNTHVYFAINHEGRLDMTVCNRSNDLVWGALGANCVHFSVLQEWMAAWIEVPLGNYYQFTNNLHGYLTTAEPLRDLVLQAGQADPYSLGYVCPTPLGKMPLTDAEGYLRGMGTGTPFTEDVLRPAVAAYTARKHNYDRALRLCEEIQASDWRKACTEWMERAIMRLERAKADGVEH